MPDVVPQPDQERIEALVTGHRVPEALALIEKFTDLRAADQPPLSKAALKTLASHSEPLRDMVLGAVSPSVSVRRFVRKHLPKVGSPVAAPLLFLAVETVDPLRPVPAHGPGLLGSFDGLASPLGASIRRHGIRLDPPKPPALHSPAAKLAREALENVHYLLSATSPRYLLLLHEMCETLQSSFRYGGAVPLERPWPGNEIFLPAWLAYEGQAELGKCKDLSLALRNWLHGRLLIDEEPAGDEAVQALRARYLALPEVNREAARRYFRTTGVKYLFCVPRDDRRDLVALADERRSSAHSVDDSFYSKYLDDFLKRFPGELEAARAAASSAVVAAPAPAAPRPAPPRAARKTSARGAKASSASAAADTPAADTPADVPAGEPFVPPTPPIPEHGSSAHDMVRLVIDLTAEVGLLDLRAELIASLTEDQREWLYLDDEPDPVTTSGPADAEVIRQLWAFPGPLEDDLEDLPLPELELRNAPWQPALAALTRRALEGLLARFATHAPPSFTYDWNAKSPAQQVAVRIGQLLQKAAAILDEKGLDTLGDAMSPEAGKIPLDFGCEKDVIEVLQKRALFPVRFIHVIFRPRRWAADDKPFQAAMARLYARPDAESQALARRTLERVPLPADANDKRTGVHRPHQWICWAAWKRADGEMLAILLERCFLSYHTAKSRPQVPEAPPDFVVDNYAAWTIQEPGVTLDEVWRLVKTRCPGRVAAILRNAFATAEIIDLPRRILDVVAACDPPALDGYADEVASLLESSQPAAAIAAARVLEARPDLAASHLEAVLGGLERAVSSTSAALVKQAAATLAVLGRANPQAAAPAQELLCRVLEREAPALVEQGLKGLCDLRQGDGRGPLSSEARARIEHLATSDPRRFEKPARRLLG